MRHEKFEVTIKDINEEYGSSVGAYYHWSNRYVRERIPGLNKKKAGVCVPHNKTPEDIETKLQSWMDLTRLSEQLNGYCSDIR